MTVVPVGVDHTVFRPLDGVHPDPRPAHGDLVQRRPDEGAGAPARGGGQAADRASRSSWWSSAGPGPGGRVDQAIERLGLRDVVRCVSGISDDELARHYGEAEVAVVPSLYEGFSLPAVEAMACGVPVVATTGGGAARGGGRRRRDGPAGPARTIPAPWPAASAGCSTTPRCARGSAQAGRQRVLHRFTWQVTAKGTAECYEALLGGTAAVPRGPDVRQSRPTGADRRLRPAGCPSPATACSTSGAGSAAMPSRRPAGGRPWWRSTPAPTRWPACGTPSAPWSTPASSTPARRGPARCRATPSTSRSPTAPSTGSSPRRCSSTSPTTWPPWPSWPACCGPGGTMAVTVPRCGPEVVNWVLSDEYHDVPGGHVRIYRRSTLRARLGLHRPGAGRQPPRPRPARALLVAPLPGRPDQRRQPGRRRLPQGAGLGHREGPTDHPAGRPGAQSADRQEPGASTCASPDRLGGATRRSTPAIRGRRAPSGRGPGLATWRRHDTDQARSGRRPRGARDPQRLRRAGHGALHRRGPAARRHDPVVPRAGTATRGTTSRRPWPCRCAACTTRPSGPTSGWPTASSPTAAGSTTTWPKGSRTPGSTPTSAPTWPPGCGTTTSSPARTTSSAGCGRRSSRALDFVLRWQQPDGSVRWSLDPCRPTRGLRAARPARPRSTTACAAGWRRPSGWARTGPTGSWPPAGLAMPWPTTPAAFAPKDEFAMDWYYPMLSGALEGERRAVSAWPSTGTPSSWTASASGACRPTTG